jgi:uncharacterized protein (DUF849 family)
LLNRHNHRKDSLTLGQQQRRAATDAVVNVTTGGAVTMTVEQRISAAQQLSPEMCSLNMGSMNFALYPMARRYNNWKFD